MSFIKKIFGKSGAEKRLGQFQPAGFAGGGLTGEFDKGANEFRLERGPERQSAIDDLVAGFRDRASEFRGLRERVRPGFGELTRTRVEAIRTAGARTVGNLREELTKRRVLGSSFAQREVTATESEFARQEESARAEAFIQELGLTAELIDEEFDATIAGLGTVLEQLNFETNIAAQLSVSASNQALTAAGASAQAASARRAGNAELFATIASAFILRD